MDYLPILLTLLGVAAAAGVVTAYYRRSEGKETIELLRANNDALKESLKIKRDRITYLQGALDEKDRLIARITKDN